MARSLKSFIKAAPNKRELAQLMDEINTGSDRAMAIVTAVMIENALADAIQARFVRLSTEDRAAIFEGMAPLSSFSSKIKVGFAPGIYVKRIRHDLDRVREIRNAFAHSRRPISFETPAIRTVCESLWFPSLFNDAYKRELADNDAIARNQYAWTTLFLYVTLGVAASKLKKRKRLSPPVVALTDK
jgi:hypothetical protein